MVRTGGARDRTRRRAIGGELDLVGAVLDDLGLINRHNAALAFAGAGSETDLDQLATTAAGRAVLDRVLDELSKLWGGAAETAAAERIMRARSTRLPPEQVQAGILGAKIFPFRLPGLTVMTDAPIEAERRPGNRVRVSLPPRVSGTYPEEARDLPWEVFGAGIELPEDEIVGVRMYDLGGEVMYRPAIFLVQLHNQTDAQTLASMATTAGLVLGGAGSAAEAGAGVMARLLVAADRIAFGVGAVAAVVKEHRGWIIAHFGESGRTYLRYVDIVNSVVAFYGGVRALGEMGRLLLGLRRAILDWRAAAALKGELGPGERALVDDIAREADAVVAEIDEAAPRRPGDGTELAEADAPAGPAAPEASRRAAGGAPVPVAALISQQTKLKIRDFLIGPLAPPQQAQVQTLLDQAWSRLGGASGRAPVIQVSPLPSGTAGWFEDWVGAFGTITVDAQAQTAGTVANTVYHEAMHGRLRDLFPFLRQGSPSYRPVAATLVRHFDEVLAYAYGGYGQLRHGATILDRLEGLLDVTLAPWRAYGSANNVWEMIPGLVRDAVLLLMLAIAMVTIALSAGVALLLACFGVPSLAPAPTEP